MEAVKAFNAELSSLYEVKPPISKAKMTALTRGAIKAIKFYKHVVQSVEKFILKCKPEYKVPGLYVIDSIVRQSRHQFGSDKDVFAPRFSKNMQQTFVNLFKCPAEDKSKIIRVLNLWQKNQVFPPEVVQPLFDLADPNNPIHKELGTPVQQPSNGLNTSAAAGVIAKGSPALQRTPTKGNQPGNESIHGATSNLNLTDPNVLQQLQQLQRLLTKSTDNSARTESQVHFDKKLLDFDYGDEEDEVNPSPRPPANDSVTSLLTNPEVLRQLQTLQQTMAGAPPEMDVDKMRKLQEMKQQEDEFDKHLAQTVPNLPFAAECEFKPMNNQMMAGYFLEGMNPPAPSSYQTQEYEQQQLQNKVGGQDNGADVEVITLDHDDSHSGTPADERYANNRRRRSRSRSRDRGVPRRDRDRDRERRRRSRSRSATRRHRSRSRERDRNRPKEKKEEKETEKDRERKKRGLPIIKKDHLSVCSTTLWVGHLSKLVHQDDLSNTFGEFGDVVSIDLIPPRGCAFIVMLRRQDAARCLGKLKGHNLHGKAITLAWAPGKGVKGKDLKDYWEGDLGVSYIPYTKIKEDIDIEMLEDGGMIDEDTMPQWMREKMERMGKKNVNIPIEMPSFMMSNEVSNAPAAIDTSQPPPMPGPGLLQPPLLPLVSPFQFNNRLISMNMPPGMMSNIPNMPNIPIGVPPPNMPGPMMTNQLLGIGSPFRGPPSMMPPQMPNMDNKPMPPSTEANLQSLSESLMNITQPFAMIPRPPAPHEDNMDVEMEDAEKSLDKPIPLSEQLQQIAAGQFGRQSRDDEKRDRRDDRERRNSRSRDRDRDRGERDRGRGHYNSRDRDRRERDNSRGRERDRRDDRRDRGNRWGDRERERDRRDIREPENRDDKREREKNLNDRLREMAGMGGFEEPNRDRPNRDRRNSENGPRNFPPPGPPPHVPDGPPGKPEEDFRGLPIRGPPPRPDFPPPRGPPHPHMEGPPGPPPGLRGPDMMRDGPPEMMMDGPPNMLEGPPMMMEGPPDMMNGPGPMQFQPPNMMEGPPDLMMDGPPNMMRDGPPNMMRDGPPNMMMDGPPNMMMDGPPPDMMMDRPLDMPPPNMMMDGPPDMPPHMRMDGPPDMPPHMRMDGPPDMPPHMRLDGPPHRMHPNADMNGPDRFMRGRRDFEPRGMRGPPPGSNFFPRDEFVPRGPQMMRGGPRGPPMRGSRGQFFGPRGHRGRGPFRDGPPNFNPRFDGPPPFRGPGPRGPPPMFEDGMHPRPRGPPRFDRMRGRPGPDFNPEFMDRGPPGPPHERPERRSRWGGSPPRHEEFEFEQEPEGQPMEEMQEQDGGGGMGEEQNREGASTPVRDECPAPMSEQIVEEGPPDGGTMEAPPGEESVAE